MVGRSEFKIDVGVINPGNTENYILGIILMAIVTMRLKLLDIVN